MAVSRLLRGLILPPRTPCILKRSFGSCPQNFEAGIFWILFKVLPITVQTRTIIFSAKKTHTLKWDRLHRQKETKNGDKTTLGPKVQELRNIYPLSINIHIYIYIYDINGFCTDTRRTTLYCSPYSHSDLSGIFKLVSILALYKGGTGIHHEHKQ